MRGEWGEEPRATDFQCCSQAVGSHWKDFKEVNHMIYLSILGIRLRINRLEITLPLPFSCLRVSCLRVV